MPAVADDPLGVHADQREVDARVILAAGQPDLAELRGELLKRPRDLAPLLVGQHGHDRAVVQRRQAGRGQAAERGHVRHEGGEQQGLRHQVVGAERVPGAEAGDLLGGDLMLRQQVRAEPVGVEPLRLLELVTELVGERAVHAARQDIEDRADRHQLADAEHVPVVDEKLLHQLERGPFPLQRPGDVHHRMHERRAERVGKAERFPVALLAVRAEQDLPRLRREGGRPGERVVEGQSRTGVLGLEQALVHDRREIAVVQLNRVEPAVPVLERVEQGGGLRAECVLADQVPQVALPWYEADDRGGPFVLGRLDQLGDLLRLQADLRGVADVAGQPEHELVEEEHDRVVAEDVPGVLADDRQALVKRDVGLLVGLDCPCVSLERADQEVADEPSALLAVRRLAERHLQRRGVPVRGAPLVVAGRELGDELLVARALPQFPRVRDELVVAEDRGERLAGVQPGDVADVAAEDRRVEGLRVGKVVGDEQESPVLQPSIVLCHDVSEALLAPGVRVAGQDGIQHGHEVALAGTERAVQVGGARRPGLHGRPDQAERAVEVGGQRPGDHIVGDRGLLADPLGQAEHEVARMHLVGDHDKVPQQHLVAHYPIPPATPKPPSADGPDQSS